MTSLAAPIAVLDDAPKSLGLSRVTAPFSRDWSLKDHGIQMVVSSTAQFLRHMPAGVVRRRQERLLLLAPLAEATLESVESLFDAVVVATPSSDLLDILRAENRADLFVRAAYDPVAEHVVLHRGDLATLVVPLAWFTPTPKGPKPDPQRIQVIDGGQTLALGDYEAAADAILYEFDPEYRKRAKKRSVATDRSFGGALKRLRLQKGLPRTAFEPAVTAKTIARIENNKVGKPRGKTLVAIAKKLGVKPEMIATY